MTTKRKNIIALFICLFGLAFWFLGIDCSYFVEECPDCKFGQDVIQYRVFTIPIHQEIRNYDTLLAKISADIGAECKHPKIIRWHKHRYWGLLICACPCINGTTRMVGDIGWYDEDARKIVKKLAKETPSFQSEISERVLKNHDWEYWEAFVNRLKQLREEKHILPPEKF